MRVVAVDDDPITLMIVAGVVEAAGHECVTAADGTAGWELMLDVDHFKAYNDRFGNPAGDEALRRVAGVLLSTGRQTDQFYRYGGEEFLCRISQDGPAATSAAERLRLAVQDLGLGHPDSPHHVVTFSAGVATWELATTQHALLAEADAALYRAKAAGRNAVRSVQHRSRRPGRPSRPAPLTPIPAQGRYAVRPGHPAGLRRPGPGPSSGPTLPRSSSGRSGAPAAFSSFADRF